jgi:DNA-binding MarR family transcriptional regulator
LKKTLYLLLAIPIIVLLFAATAKASPAISFTSVDAAGGKMEMDVKLDCYSDIVNSGNSIPLTVEVRDGYNVPVEGALVLIHSYPESEYFSTEMVTDESGRARAEFSAHTSEERSYNLIITVLKEGYKDVETNFVVTVFPAQDLKINNDVSILIGAMMLTSFMSTEVGKYGAFKAIMFPLYTRLKKEEVLDHFVRGQIYGHIMAHPGENYSSIKDELKVTNGTLSHHLRTLEVQGFIKSRRIGMHTRFYPIDMKIPQEKGIKLSDLQIKIIELIKGNRALTQSDIAEKLNVSQQCVSYNLRLMNREGIIGIERSGRDRKYFLMDT